MGAITGAVIDGADTIDRRYLIGQRSESAPATPCPRTGVATFNRGAEAPNGAIEATMNSRSVAYVRTVR